MNIILFLLAASSPFFVLQERSPAPPSSSREQTPSEKDEVDQLEERFSLEIQKNPESATPEFVRASLAELSKILSAHKADKTHGKALIFAASLHMMIDETDAAMEKITAYLAGYPQGPEAPSARTMKMDLLLRTQRLAEAIAFAQDVLKNPDTDTGQTYELRLRLVHAYLMNGGLPEASRLLESMNDEFKDREERWPVLMLLATVAKLEEDRTQATRILADIAKNCKYRELVQSAELTLSEYERVGAPVEDFVVSDSRGGSFSIGDQKGKVTVLLFWTATEESAMATFGLVDHLFKKYRDQDVVALGICVDKDKRVFQEFTKLKPVDWPQTHDPDHDLASLFTLRQVPHIILVDRKGVVRFPQLQGPELGIALDRIVKEK